MGDTRIQKWPQGWVRSASKSSLRVLCREHAKSKQKLLLTMPADFQGWLTLHDKKLNISKK